MPEKPGGHLTRGDRKDIEEYLRDSMSLAAIAEKIGVSKTTISKEVKKNRVNESPAFMDHTSRNICMHIGSCHAYDLCGRGCVVQCRECKSSLCNEVCPEFLPNECPYTLRAPYVCNDCKRRFGYGCGFRHWYYDGNLAHEMSEARKSASRQGVDCTMEELQRLVEIVRPRLLNGQSPENIWLDCGDDLPVSLRTFYYYVERGIFESIVNLHLPKKVAIKIRKKKPKEPPVPRHELAGRTYQDFEALPLEDQMSAVEMDCVEGRRGEKPAILTLLFRRFSFQIMMLLPEQNQEEVAKALAAIERLIGAEAFKAAFSIVLTDRGSEFLDYAGIEASTFSGKRCSVYYRDPMKSGQKGRCEKNHVELRKIIPKGTSLRNLSPRKLAVVCSHVNSYGRPKLGGAAPYQLASQVLPPALFEGLGIERVEPKEVVMKSTLIKL